LKNSNIKQIGIGTSAYGSRVDPTESQKILNNLLNIGIDYIDTAPLYGAGIAEEIVGKTYKDRSKVIIATKFGLNYQKKSKLVKHLLPIARLIFKFPIISKILSNRKVSHDSGVLSIDEIKKSINSSLEKLNTTYIDVLFIHNNIHYYLNNNEILTYLHELRKTGVIKKIGVTTSLKDKATFDLIKNNLNTIEVIQVPLSNYEFFLGLNIEINCFSAFSQGNIDESKIFNYIKSKHGRLIVFFKSQKNLSKNLSYFNIN
jgi:aryl-alcohol dehydrogenase-like predicted oxidoreductase